MGEDGRAVKTRMVAGYMELCMRVRAVGFRFCIVSTNMCLSFKAYMVGARPMNEMSRVR